MSQDIFSSSRIFVGETEFTNYSSINYKNAGSNKITQLSVKIEDPDLDCAALMGKEITFYLNYGSIDNVPFFRGRIKQVQPTDKDISIIAYDILTFLGGKESIPISITDKNNYDGFTLSQFLHDYISTKVNQRETLIGLDMLNETDPQITLSKFRAKKTTALKVVQSNLKDKTSDLEDIRSYRLLVRDDGTKSNITFVREQDIDSGTINFTLNDGIEKISFKRRSIPNVFTTLVGKNNSVEYISNSLPTGVIAQAIKGDFKYPDEARQEAIIQAKKEENRLEVSISTNKGHYLDIGNLINIYTPQYPEANGKHRILSKNISVSRSGVKCSLMLNKESPSVTDYLEIN
jgi:hypothetical protein